MDQIIRDMCEVLTTAATTVQSRDIEICTLRSTLQNLRSREYKILLFLVFFQIVLIIFFSFFPEIVDMVNAVANDTELMGTSTAPVDSNDAPTTPAPNNVDVNAASTPKEILLVPVIVGTRNKRTVKTPGGFFDEIVLVPVIGRRNKRKVKTSSGFFDVKRQKQ